jgi:cyclic-di-GMP phosphodiesterase TipF (flagellum assembly factor)
MFPDFLTTPHDEAESKPKGLFLFGKHGKSDEFARLRRRLFLGTVTAAIAGTGLLYLVGQYATPDFLVLVSALILLGGLVVYDILSRRLWESAASEQIQTLIRNHDRLVREVARSRSEITVLKEGLYDTATAVEEQGKNQMPSSSIEAKMIGTIISRLAAMGKKALPGDPLPKEQPPAKMDSGILELQIAPPPSKAPPMSEMEEAMDSKFAHYSDAMILGLLEQAVQDDRIDVFVQPVVSLPQRKHRMYEVFGRIRAMTGTYLPAEHYMRLAQKENLMTTVDNLLLLRCLQILRDRKDKTDETPYILNVSVETLNDTGFMGDLVTFLSQNRGMASRLIFELPQEQLEHLSSALVSVLDGLSQLGVRFSMDRVRSGKIDINLLKSRHVRFIKFDGAWLIKEAQSSGGSARVSRLKTQLDAAGIDLIVEKIETEKALRELLDFGIDYGQGWHFGKPDLYGTHNNRKVA